jgi:hypothetical protein
MDSPITLVAFCTGVTALVKKLGVQGNYLVLVCVLAGALYTYLMNFQPALLQSLSGVILALAATGNVSLTSDMLSRIGTLPAGGGGAAE